MFLAEKDNLAVKIADTPDEIESALHLRYKVFYEEHHAKPDEETLNSQKDCDRFDSFVDHLIVVHRDDQGKEQIVGTYRLLRQSVAEENGGFYSSSEFDLSPLLAKEGSLMEVGRSCVLPDFRTRGVLNLMWQSIANYIALKDINGLFGCASLEGTDVEQNKVLLSYLYHYHMAPEDIRITALDSLYTEMNLMPKEDINPRRAFSALPPLIKGYLRLGGTVGNGAVVDEQFNTTDVFILVQTHQVSERYRKHYERNSLSSTDEDPTEVLGTKIGV